MPLTGSTNYRRNLRDVDVDTRLAEEFANRQERFTRDQLEAARAASRQSAQDTKEISYNMAKGLDQLPDIYRKGAADKIKLGQQRRENDWRQDMDAEEQSSALNTTNGPLTPSDSAEYTNPSLEYIKGNMSTQEYVGMPTRVDTVKTPGAKLRGEIRASPGAAPVLDGKIKAGINPAIFAPDSEESTAQYPALQPKAAPVPQKAQLMASEESKPIRNARYSNEELMWRAARDKQMADAANAKKGKLQDPYQQARLDLDRDKLQLEREKMGKGPANDYQSMALEQRQKEHEDRMKLERDKLAAQSSKGKPPAAGGLTDYQKAQIERQKQLDAEKDEAKKAGIEAKKQKDMDTGTTKYMDKIGNIPDAVSSLETIITMIPEKGDIPGYGQTGMAPNFVLSPGGKQLRNELERVFNITLKDRSGAAVTVPEFERLKSEFGTGALKTDDDLRYALGIAVRAIKEKIQSINAGFDPSVIGQYKERGGRDFQSFDPKFKQDSGQAPKSVGKKPIDQMSVEELEAELKGQ